MFEVVSRSLLFRLLSASHLRVGIYPDKGAFCKFLKADTNILWKIPEGSVSMEEALTLGTCVMTSVQAMFHPDRLNMVEYPKQADPETWVRLSISDRVWNLT